MSSKVFSLASLTLSLVACGSTPPLRTPAAEPPPEQSPTTGSSPETSDAATPNDSDVPPRAGLRTTTSASDFATTVDRARRAIESRDLTLIAEIEHSENAQRVDMELRATTLFVFGNPKVGTELMAERQTTGIDLPLKLLVWQDEEGAVHLAYNDPAWIFERHDVRDKAELLGKMRGVLSGIAAEAASP